MRRFTFAQLEACFERSWQPGIGDPTMVGWLTVGAYALAALLCFLAAVPRPKDRWFWILTGLLMLFLSVNKQLDLQSAMTAGARCLSQLQGWYNERREFQESTISTLVIVGGAITVLLLVLNIRRLHRIGLALVGLSMLVIFILVRAVGFHDMDALLATYVGEYRVNWILELSGIALVALNALVVALADPEDDFIEVQRG